MSLRKNKRGAIELSITTIVVVVIGITILTLGLKWVFNIFGGLEQSRQKLSEATEQRIRETFGDSSQPINLLTSSAEIAQNQYYDLAIGLKNTYGEQHSFKYIIEPTDIPAQLQASQVSSWLRWDKSTLSLKSGELYTDTISIDPKDAPLGVYKLKVTLTCLDCGTPTEDAAPLTIRIVSKK